MVKIVDQEGNIYEANSVKEFATENGLGNTDGVRRSLGQTLQRDTFYKGFKVIDVDKKVKELEGKKEIKPKTKIKFDIGLENLPIAIGKTLKEEKK